MPARSGPIRGKLRHAVMLTASLIGETVGGYTILAKIGEGGMGAVFSAENGETGRRAAVKVLLPEPSSNPDAVIRFFNEANAIANLKHPSIVQVLDFGYHANGRAYLVMELLEGESLGTRLDRVGRIETLEAVRLGRQIAAAMSAAHARAVVHRDLKPDNVFLLKKDPGAAEQ